MHIEEEMRLIAKQAKVASQSLAPFTTEEKNKALLHAAECLLAETEFIQQENKKDLDKAQENGLTAAMLDRLKLDDKRVEAMAIGLREIADLNDPVGKVLSSKVLDNQLELTKVTVPLGVIFMIYESRPNVTADASALCLKAGNVTILRGGREALNSNKAIASVLQRAYTESGLPENTLQLITVTDYEAVNELLKCEHDINLVIPRGGPNLIQAVTSQSRIPVVKHDKGLCHTYVDAGADLKMAEEIVLNAKTQRPGVCNAMETLLVHQDLKESFLPKVIQSLQAKGVEVRGNKEVMAAGEGVVEAEEHDWETEYLDLVLSIKLVKDIDAAIAHIREFGSGHSESIVTQDEKMAQKFITEVDASAVFHNASTRFNDGGQFGMGAEIGISTDKIHARGPMGIDELTSYKFVVRGNGQIRA